MKKAGITYLKFVFPAFLLLLGYFTAKAQRVPLDSLGNQIALYGLKNQSPVLYIHFDKNVYSNNENVWFTAYLFNADYKAYKTLSLALVKDDDRSVLMEDKFVITNGLSFGNTFVPDSVGPGNYSFIATTNRLVNGKPEVVFTQPVTIKSESKHSYTASLNPLDTAVNAVNQKVLLLVNFNITDPKEVPKTVPVSYYVGNTAHPVLTGAVKTQGGQYVFNIPSKLLSPGNNRLHVRVTYKNEVKDINIALPVPPKPDVVNFYPEGGSLVNNILSTVGFEVKSAAGNPMGISAMLYENDKVVDTIETNTYGMGSFKLIPKAGSNYSVKLYGVNKKDTAYKLPTPITQGPTLSVTNAIVNDTLTVIIKDNQKETLYLSGHNYKQLFFTTAINMTGPVKRIKFVLKDVPKGLTQLTLTDSLNRPFAERLFFAHYNQRTPVTITADKAEYAPREKVTLKVKLDKADSGFVSIACVQENRIEIKKKSDIESYFYLKHDLNDIPARETYLTGTEADKNFLENILLIKGWSRYTWTDMLKTQPEDITRKYETLAFRGRVNRLGQRLDKPVILSINSPIKIISTDQSGNFNLDDENMIVAAGEKIQLMFDGGKDKTYNINVFDPYVGINKQLAKQSEIKNTEDVGRETSKYLMVADNEHTIHLKEVNIKRTNDGSLYNTDAAAKPTKDLYSAYVNGRKVYLPDRNNDLYDGKTVDIEGAGAKQIKKETYIPSQSFLSRIHNPLEINGIYVAKEFYPEDYSKDSPSQPKYVSTLFWKHQLKVSSAKEAEVSFYTGDITGTFKIVVQGVAGNDVTYGESSFNVVKAK